MQAASSTPPEIVPPLDVMIPVMVCLSMQWGKELSSCVCEATFYGLRASATPLYGKFW